MKSIRYFFKMGAIMLVLCSLFFVNCKKEESRGRPTPMWLSELNLPDVPYNYSQLNLPNYYYNQFITVADNTPESNPITDWGATLGRVLFYDTRLSENYTISCSSCHIQEFGFGDTARFSKGFEGRRTPRHSMALVNSRYYVSGKFFWDERAHSLEDQVVDPIMDHIEMGMTLDSVVDRLEKTPYYGQLFAYAFGNRKIDSVLISRALSQFIRSIVSTNSKYDEGRKMVASTESPFPNFTQSENRGKEVYFNPNQLNCGSCHMTDAFFGDMARNNGLPLSTDQGVGGITGNQNDMHTFKSPSLKNIAIRPPYMHDGRFDNLKEVIEHYSSGIADHNLIDPHFRMAAGRVFQFNFSEQEKEDLLNFLETLTDDELLRDKKFSNPFY